MKRWHLPSMQEMGRKLFAKIYKRKQRAHHNHELHFMAREIDQWLTAGTKALISGTYEPRNLRRFHFSDEVVDHLHPSDRIFQHVLLQQLKPTFSKVMNPNCYHIFDPRGVGLATQRIRHILEEKNPQFFIRVDVKSFYRSIPHFKLIQDLKQYYDDPHLLKMLEAIITNPIETSRGYKNPVHGVALRGPLSQFFSGIYLKKLDDVFSGTSVDYFRYNDDILILCKTKNQFTRSRRRLMKVLHERRLTLSQKKSRMGFIHKGFHFLGVNYLEMQPQNNITNVTHSNDDTVADSVVNSLTCIGGGRQQLNTLRMSPYALFRMQGLYVTQECKFRR